MLSPSSPVGYHNVLSIVRGQPRTNQPQSVPPSVRLSVRAPSIKPDVTPAENRIWKIIWTIRKMSLAVRQTDGRTDSPTDCSRRLKMPAIIALRRVRRRKIWNFAIFNSSSHERTAVKICHRRFRLCIKSVYEATEVKRRKLHWHTSVQFYWRFVHALTLCSDFISENDFGKNVHCFCFLLYNRPQLS